MDAISPHAPPQRPLYTMHPPDKEPSWISADGPVNRRTALLEQRQREETQTPVNPEALERALRSHRRNALGAPLAEQLAAVERPGAQQAPTGLFIGSGVLVACGAVIGLLGVIQSSGTTVGGGVATGMVGLMGLFWVRRRSGNGSDATRPVQPLFDSETLDAFDRVLDEACAELGDAPMHPLMDIKQSIASIARHARGVDEHFTTEDRLFLRECLRRYIPDTLEAFLRVPAGQRNTALLDSQTTAEATLLRQLLALREEIAQREKKIGRSAAEGLMQQDRFLASKRSR